MPFLGGPKNPRRRSSPFRAILITIFIIYALYFLVFARQKSARQGIVNNDTPLANEVHSQDALTAEHTSLDRPQDAVESTPLGKTMVVGRMKDDNTTWLFDNFSDWNKMIYTVDDRNADLTVPQNKGRESMVYLTYIIDHYDDLPDVMLFIHPTRYQWHNDDPYYDGIPPIRNFQIPYLQEQGYVNLRCTWTLGCPAEIHPLTDTHRDDVHAGEYFQTGFKQLFPGVDVPNEVGVSCCAQFAVTRDKVRERPRSDYEHYRTWLLETPLADDLSGRIMEYSWHIIFGRDPVHCPNAKECYCNVFGLCDLECSEPGECAGRYILPPYASLPAGWPYLGWKGQVQDPTSGLPES